MKQEDKLDKIQAVIKSIMFGGQKKCVATICGPVVSIARDYGAGGNETGRILARKLGVVCVENDILDHIVKEAKTDKNLMKILDERPDQGFFSEWIYSMVSNNALDRSYYLKRLFAAIYKIADVGGVIMGRGAHLILDDRNNVFRMKIEGSVDFCAQRVAKRETLDLEQARRKVIKTNSERTAFVREIFSYFPSNKTYYDLVLNADRLSPEQMADIALNTMRQMGFYVPERSLNNGKQGLYLSHKEPANTPVQSRAA